MNQANIISRNLSEIHTAAARFRSALEQGGLRLISLAKFPHGSCGDTCQLLGQFLVDSGLGDWRFCAGYRDDPFRAHAWLEQDGLILDITADQFADVHESVWLTRDRTWHERYSLMERPRLANIDHLLAQDFAVDAELDYRKLLQRVAD